MNRDEFISRFRGRMLLCLTEAWAVRKAAPSDLGILLEQHNVNCEKLLVEMWSCLQPAQPLAPKAPVNGPRAPR